jgi:GNAT superfamily N-acetyltransferase
MAEIRLAIADDVPALEDLIIQSVKGLSTSYYEPEQITSALTFIFGVDTQLIEDRTYFVVASGSELAGAGGWSKRATLFGGDQLKGATGDPLLDPTIDSARIRAFYVHPDWARRGVARLILQTCEEAARVEGFKRAELMATLPGEPFYSAMGYQRLEHVEAPMPDGKVLTGFRMTKQL